MADLSSKEIDRAIDLCQFMLKRAYCPYSNFPVACVLVSDKHEMITGEYRGVPMKLGLFIFH